MVIMAGKSNRRKKQSSSSSSCSSDSDEDPDYTARLPQRLCRQEAFTCSKECHRKNTCEANKVLHKTASVPRLKAQRFCATNKDDEKQGEKPLSRTMKLFREKAERGCLSMERIHFGRKRSPSLRNWKFEDEIGKGNKILMSKRSRASENEIDRENHRYYARRRRNQYGEAEKKQKRATIFSWLIDSKTIVEYEEVFYMDDYNKKIIKEGIIRRDGISCTCCHKIFTAESFVLHGGRRSNKPYDLIFISRHQLSLLSCMINAWNKPENRKCRKFNEIEPKGSAGDKYDDACMICADGGNLMCCEECNSTYHQDCVDLEVVPRGSWYCPYCICKFCGDPAPENDYLLECPQCEKRYHWECHLRRDLKIIDLNSIPCAPFCERSCKEVHDKLEKKMVGMKNELEEGFSWSLLHRMDNDTGIYLDDKYKRTVCHSKLAVALRLMEDCFEQIVDRHTRIGVIPSVVYNCGSNFNRIQFRGFYTAILEKDEEIICVATLRIQGTNLAEMPFIATSEIHRCKGMCKKLMIAIESALCYLNVENLIIPSTSERISNWIEKYGFHLLDKALTKEIIIHNTLMFHDSIRLQKNLVSPHLAKSSRNITEMPLRKARSNHHENWLSFKHKATMRSIFDLEFQTPEWNKKPWLNNVDRSCRLTYRNV